MNLRIIKVTDNREFIVYNFWKFEWISLWDVLNIWCIEVCYTIFEYPIVFRRTIFEYLNNFRYSIFEYLNEFVGYSVRSRAITAFAACVAVPDGALMTSLKSMFTPVAMPTKSRQSKIHQLVQQQKLSSQQVAGGLRQDAGEYCLQSESGMQFVWYLPEFRYFDQPKIDFRFPDFYPLRFALNSGLRRIRKPGEGETFFGILRYFGEISLASLLDHLFWLVIMVSK